MAGRTYMPGDYRFGFNGKENDNEVEGEGNSIDFGARIYDPRLGRFLSMDPLENKLPYVSPYNYCLNNPIFLMDPDGQFLVYFMIKRYESASWFATPLVSAGDGRQHTPNANSTARSNHAIGIETSTPDNKNPIIYDYCKSSKTH